MKETSKLRNNTELNKFCAASHTATQAYDFGCSTDLSVD